MPHGFRFKRFRRNRHIRLGSADTGNKDLGLPEAAWTHRLDCAAHRRADCAAAHALSLFVAI
jgi:hypothetical protein